MPAGVGIASQPGHIRGHGHVKARQPTTVRAGAGLSRWASQAWKASIGTLAVWKSV
jgi:hypothetical protein